MKADL